MTDVPVGRAFWSDLVRQIATRTRNQDDAEDLLHSAYLRLVRYQVRRPVDDVAAFLVKTALNMNIDNRRHLRVHNKAMEFPPVEDLAPLQDEVVAARVRLVRVKAGLERLPPRTRQVVLMHRLNNLKYSEIASRLGISASAVEKHAAKAALFLAKWVEGW
jgi:RNA polymerase sigma factor (sigma-70 family)